MFVSLPEYTQRLRLDLRRATIHNQTLQRVHLSQKQKLETIEEILKEKDKRIKELERENEKLKQVIEKLTKTNNRYQVALFDQGNFHHPKEKGKKPNGGQVGHADTNQDKNRNKASFARQRIFAATCGNCGNHLPRVASVKEKTLIDIQINTQLIQVVLQSERQWCRNCRKEVTAKSTQTLPFTEYGMNTFMVIMLLRFKSHQSIQKISTVLSLGFGLTLSQSEILSLLKQAKTYLKDKYDKLKKAIREGAVMYNDETGWNVNGQKAWMWIMINEQTTVYVAAESRGKGIFEQMYGQSTAISMHDGDRGRFQNL